MKTRKGFKVVGVLLVLIVLGVVATVMISNGIDEKNLERAQANTEMSISLAKGNDKLLDDKMLLVLTTQGRTAALKFEIEHNSERRAGSSWCDELSDAEDRECIENKLDR